MTHTPIDIVIPDLLVYPSLSYESAEIQVGQSVLTIQQNQLAYFPRGIGMNN